MSAAVVDTPHPPAAPGRPGRNPWPILFMLGVVAALTAALVLRPVDRAVVAPTPAVRVGKDKVTIPEGAPQWKYVSVEVATAKTPLEPLPVTGHVLADEGREASVSAPFEGRLEQLAVRLGDRVKAGQRIALVRAGALADVEREVTTAEAWRSARASTVERVQKLVESDAAPRRELEEARAALAEAEASVTAALARRAALTVRRTGATSAWLTAPRAGTVISLGAEVGDAVGPGTERIARIASLDEVMVIADVREREVHDLSTGVVAKIRTGAGVERFARIERVSEVLDPERRTVQVRLRVNNRDREFRPNAFVDVTFPAPSGADRVQLPSASVVTDSGHPVVFVAGEGGSLHRRGVTVGRSRDGVVEILEGLMPGERVVTTGALLLQNELDLAD